MNNKETMMKKLLIALAILAVASVAQAELLATWSTVGGAVTDGADGATVSDLSVYGGAATTGSSIWGMNSMTTGGGFQFTVSSIMAGAVTGVINNAVIAGGYTGSATGPNVLNWYVGSTLVDTVDRGTTPGGSFGAGTGGDLGTINSGDVVSLRADTTGGTVRSGTAETFSNTGGSFYINKAMTLNGDIVPAVPEPATMGLLGLGALAMVLRRKIRK